MTDQDCSLNIPVIDQWIDDLLDPGFGIKFNADILFGRTPRGKLSGDAALFLAYRQAEIEDCSQFEKWYKNLKSPPDGDFTVSEYIITTYTRIPILHARALVWPQELLDESSYELSKMTPRQFVTTLRNYLETGIVSWEWLLLKVEK